MSRFNVGDIVTHPPWPGKLRVTNVNGNNIRCVDVRTGGQTGTILAMYLRLVKAATPTQFSVGDLVVAHRDGDVTRKVYEVTRVLNRRNNQYDLTHKVGKYCSGIWLTNSSWTIKPAIQELPKCIELLEGQLATARRELARAQEIEALKQEEHPRPMTIHELLDTDKPSGNNIPATEHNNDNS